MFDPGAQVLPELTVELLEKLSRARRPIIGELRWHGISYEAILEFILRDRKPWCKEVSRIYKNGTVEVCDSLTFSGPWCCSIDATAVEQWVGLAKQKVVNYEI